MLEHRIALITGASRGIGAATARMLAEHGAAVAVNYLNNSGAAADVVSAITSAGGRAIAVKADVRDRGEVEAMMNTVSEALGPVDTLVLNAHLKCPIAPALDQKWEDFEAKLTGELKAAFYCVTAAVPGMQAKKKGCIIAISSGVSQYPPPGASAHSVAKSALNAFMKCLALELGPSGIRVNTIAPGLIMTDNTAPLPAEFKQAMANKTPLRRNGLPEDIAGAILMLAQDGAGFVTGTYLNVDGGVQVGQTGTDISAVNRSQATARPGR
jgi:3-oxoacyl-[acyl-carrier protein] reductase